MNAQNLETGDLNDTLCMKAILVRIDKKEKIIESLDGLFEFISQSGYVIAGSNHTKLSELWDCIQNGTDKATGQYNTSRCWAYSLGNNSGNPLISFKDVTGTTCINNLRKIAEDIERIANEKYGKIKDFKISLTNFSDDFYILRGGLNWIWDSSINSKIPINEIFINSDETDIDKMIDYIDRWITAHTNNKNNS